MNKDYWFQFIIGEWFADTAHLSLAATGALANLRAQAWNASTRGVLCLTMEGYARLFRSTVDQASRVIDELTGTGNGLITREDVGDGAIRLTLVRDAHRAAVSSTRAESGRKGGRASVLLKQKLKQTSKQTSDCDCSSSGHGGAGGKGGEPDTPNVSDSPPAQPPPPPEPPPKRDKLGLKPRAARAESDVDAEKASDNDVYAWLDGIPRFPICNVPPKHVSQVAQAVRKWGWAFVREAIEVALDKGASVPIAYAMQIANERAGRAFARQARPLAIEANGRKWRPG